MALAFSGWALTATLLACGAAGDPSAAPLGGETAIQTAALCPGVHIDSERVKSCTEPYRIRQGRACDANAAATVCPSANLLQGDCRCESGAWSCDSAVLPEGYDPYPDCPDQGVVSNNACYLEGSTCIPAAAAACFTSKVPLCTCTGHSWNC